MKLATDQRAGGPSLIILSFICLVAGLVCCALFEGSAWASIAGLVLLVTAVGVSIYTLYKERGPFEISVFGLAILSLGIGSACFLSVGVHDQMVSAINTTLLKDWDWVALIVAAVSLIFAACTWVSQEKTQRNTMRITPDIQFALLRDIFRDTYRMLEVVCALERKMEGRYATHYPAEYHFYKLQYSEDMIYPESFIDEPSNCSLIKNLGVNFRNANIDIHVATKHISSPAMHPEIKKHDFEMLKKRIIYTLERTREVMKTVWHKTDAEIADAVREYVITEAQDRHNEKREKWLKEADEVLKSEKDYYYHATEKNYIGILFPGQINSDEAKEFLRKFNRNIYYMLNSDAICIIPFDSNTPLELV